MSTNSKDLRETLNAHHKCERRKTFAEACYWLSQYKELALRAIRYAEKADKELEHLRSFVNDNTLKYEELRKLIDGGSESMTHDDAIAELQALLSSDAELQKLREQKPVAWDCGGSITANSGYAEWFSRKDHGAAVPLYTSPVPAPAAPDANPVQWLADEGDMILVPRGLLGAACSSIDKQRPAPKVLEALRYYTMNAPQAPAVPDGDDFNGTTPHLILCMEALVRLDADGVLVPHGIGRDASKLLSAAANRLRKQPAPSVPEEWPAMLRTGRPIRREAWNPEAFIWFFPGDEKNHSTVMLYTHGKVHAGWIGLHCDHHARDWVYCDDMALDLLQSGDSNG